MPLIYSEGRDNAAGRLREAVDEKEKGKPLTGERA